MFASFLVTLRKAWQVRKPSVSNRARLRLESLEDLTLPAVLTVNTVSDSGVVGDPYLSLREAIHLANGDPDVNPAALSVGEQVMITGTPGANQADEIRFHFDDVQAGPFVIELQDWLPAITDAITIDGSTQPGFAGTPVVELVGNAIPVGIGAGEGLRIEAGSSTIRGLVIREFRGTGILLIDGGNNRIENNYIGVRQDGMSGAANTKHGIELDNSGNNIIGGSVPGTGNLISGNLKAGIYITGDDSDNNQISRNVIGFNRYATAVIANLEYGICLADKAENNVIGGLSTVEGNTIGGNTWHGVAWARTHPAIRFPTTRLRETGLAALLLLTAPRPTTFSVMSSPGTGRTEFHSVIGPRRMTSSRI